ncbi:DUF4340 domain-containing protein [Patescibacteria group bacterium]|nr:DUF4340 domain-containing protein [Patescibacteria group bacterium]
MKSRHIKLLGIIFVALLVVSLIPQIQEVVKDRVSKKSSVGGIEKKNLLVEFQVDQVQSVVITKGGSSINLTKQNNSWYVGEHKASDSKVNVMLDGLSSMEVIETASINPKNHEDLGVSEELGYLVTIETGDQSINLIIGKRAQVSNTYYVRTKHSDETVLVQATIPRMATLGDDWRDKLILDVYGKELTRVDLSVGGVKKSISEGDENWQAAIQTFSPLNADSFLNVEEISEYESTRYRGFMTLTFKDGAEEKLDILDKEDFYWISKGGNHYKVRYQVLQSVLGIE